MPISMWIMKISIPWRKTALLSDLAKKHKVTVVGYPISSEIKKDAVYVITSGLFMGESGKLKDFCKDMLKDKRTLKLENKENFGIVYMKQHPYNRFLYQSGVFHIKPATITKEGEYILELGSWEKEKLMKIIKVYEKFNVKLHWIKQKKINNVQILNIFPNLTEKQKKCLQIAINNKYYGFPRKIDLKTLAKKAGISYSTYQFHLRVAEKKIMPFLNENLYAYIDKN